MKFYQCVNDDCEIDLFTYPDDYDGEVICDDCGFDSPEYTDEKDIKKAKAEIGSMFFSKGEE